MIYKSFFDTQGEAMTQARRLAESKHLQRPYVFMVRPDTSYSGLFYKWAIKDGVPGVVMNARGRQTALRHPQHPLYKGR